MTLRIEDRAFRADMARFKKRSSRRFKHAVLSATLKMREMAKKKARQHIRGSKTTTGNLINRIEHVITKAGFTGAVISRAPYSEAFEKGTKPHTIRTKSKAVLAGPYRGRPSGWRVSKGSKSMGYATYGKRVQHPGTSAHPYMQPAFRFAMKRFDKEMKKAL